MTQAQVLERKPEAAPADPQQAVPRRDGAGD
jgi:hypothetical protein